VAFRVAHLSDPHLAERTRFAGTLRVLEAFAAGVELEDVDLVIVAGDLVDPRRAPARATPRERNALAGILRRCAMVCPVVVVRGNHDAAGDWSFLELLEATFPIFYCETPTTIGLAEDVSARIDDNPPEWFVPRVVVHAVPWLSPAWFADQVAELGLSLEDGHAWIEDAVRPVFDRIAAERSARPDALHVGVGHLSVRGGKLAGGQALVGGEVQIGAESLARLGLHYFGLGHLHESQEVYPGAPVWYAGSPNRLDFGETGKPCGWILATLEEDAGRTVVDFVDLPADELVALECRVLAGDDGRPPWLDFVEGGQDDADGPIPLYPDDVAGADVRVRVLVPEGLHAEDPIAELVAFIREAGGRPTVQRITVAALRVREGAEAVASAPTVAGKVRTYLEQRDHEAGQVARVLARLEAVEGRAA